MGCGPFGMLVSAHYFLGLAMKLHFQNIYKTVFLLLGLMVNFGNITLEKNYADLSLPQAWT